METPGGCRHRQGSSRRVKQQPAQQSPLDPAQSKQALADFAGMHESHKAFLLLPENRNLPRQLGTPLRLLTVTDDPLVIEADIVTAR